MPTDDAQRRLTIVGESLVDIIDDSTGRRTAPGGSPLNVAVGLARLGVTPHFISELGDDDHGELVRRHLTRAGVPLDGVRSVPRTAQAHATLGVDGAARYDFDLPWTLPAQPVVSRGGLHSGSIGSWLEPGADSVQAMFSSRGAEVLASFDPNIRPSLIVDPDRVRHRVRELSALSDVVKMSDEDAEWLFPDDPLSAIPTTLAAGAKLAVLTRGSRGAILASRKAQVSIAAPQVAVVDTIGAGDSFMAGLLARMELDGLSSVIREGLADESLLEQLGQFATRCAAITVSRPGADPPTIADLDGPSAAR